MDAPRLSARGRAAIVGALVADSAALGFHWLYDQARVAEVSARVGSVVFRTPTEADYDGTMGYFAWAGKAPGDSSQYGTNCAVMLSALAKNQGAYVTSDYIDVYSKAFGYGGTYVGYIDTPTRQTLDNLARQKRAQEEKIEEIEFSGSHDDRHMMVVKARGSLAKYGADKAAGRAYMERAILETHPAPNVVAFGLKVFDALAESSGDFPGADDIQVGALSNLPPIIALCAGTTNFERQVEDAVRVTNNNDTAIVLAISFARILESAILGKTAHPGPTLMATGRTSPEATGYINAASAFNDSLVAAAASFGKACPLKNSFPVIMTAINSGSLSYRTVVEQNILAAGDSCGRSIPIGALYGACFGIGGENGIPQEWVDMYMAAHPEVLAQLDSLSA